MSLVESDVEILKLARLLGTEPEQLGYLRQVPWQDIRDLREQANVVMFEADRETLQRVAASTRMLPSKLTATVGERAFGPVLSARVTGMLEPGRAVEIADRLPVKFLSDLAEQLDPRRASRVIAEIPPRRIAEITRELARRAEYVTMGGFVGHIPEAALKAALDSVDDEALLHAAAVVESKSSLGALVAIIPDERLVSIMRTATEQDLWAEALDVLTHLGDRQRGQLGDLAAAQDDDVLESLVRTAQRDGLWADVLPVTRAMSEPSRVRFAKLKTIQTRPVLSSIVDAATQRALWAELLVLLPLLPAASRRRVAALGTGFGRSILQQIVDAAHADDLWAPLLGFAVELEVRTQRDLAKLFKALDDDTLDALLVAVAHEERHAEFVAIVARLGAGDMRAFARRLADFVLDEILDALVEAAAESGLGPLSKALRAT